MKDIFARAASDPRRCPATVTSPSSARYTPASTLMRVGFPAPLGPRRASTLPRWRSRLTPSSATVPPNRLPRPDTRTSGSPPEREGGPLVEVSEGSWASCMDVSGADLGSPVREGGTGMMLRAVQGHSVYDGSYAASRANLTQMALPWGCGGYLMHRPAVRRGTGHGPVRGGAPRWCRRCYCRRRPQVSARSRVRRTCIGSVPGRTALRARSAAAPLPSPGVVGRNGKANRSGPRVLSVFPAICHFTGEQPDSPAIRSRRGH